LYEYLTSEDTTPGFTCEIPWNFTRFLVNRQGQVVARFEPRTKPDSEEVVEAGEKALKER
jgi:glutathione peroxidase